MEKFIKFNYLKDEPISKEQPGFFRFYHGNFSPALKEIIENESCVHTIGLFGKWGTGKSTIIDLLQSELGLKLFLFDAWKYQDDSLRRIFLIKLVDFLKINKVSIDETILDPLHKSTEIKTMEKIKNRGNLGALVSIWGFIKKKWLFFAIILFAAGWLIFDRLASKGGLWSSARAIFQNLTGLSVTLIILKPIFEEILKESTNKLFASLLPLSEVREKIEKQERLNSPEQFEDLFNEIIQTIKEKIVIVFDNIDRVQGDTAIKILSTIKTFLDPIEKSKVVFIVPCDSDAINQQIKSFYGKNAAEEEKFDPSEYLRKLFNVIIYTPEFIDTDLEEYTRHQLEQSGDVKEILINDDVVLIITKAFSTNPREIKQFINNLISAVLVISKTEVGDFILQKENIAYLAKVLVLKQKFPKAYDRLKEKWYDPNNIIQDGDDKELIDFVNSTSRIRIDDAEPYIYFKDPTVADNINDPQALRQSLLLGDEKKFEELYESEKDKSAVIKYIILLMNRYQNQPNLLLKIFKIQLSIFAKSAVEITQKDYFDKSLRVLDNNLWQNFLTIPADQVFSLLLNNVQADKSLKKNIIDRYILSLSNDQLKQPANKEFLLNLTKNFISYSQQLSKKQKTQIAQAIEQGHANNYDLLNLFRKVKEREIYVTSNSFRQFLQNITNKSVEVASELIIGYKDFIAKNEMGLTVAIKIQECVSMENSESPDYRAQKEPLFIAINKLLQEFGQNIEKLTPEEKQTLFQPFMQAFNNISDWNNKSVVVNSLRLIRSHLEDNQKNEISTLLTQFFQNAGSERIKTVLQYWNKDQQKDLLGEQMGILLPRMIGDKNIRDTAYDFADDEQKIQMSDFIIRSAPNHGLEFVRSLKDNFGDRQAVIQQMLNKAMSLNPNQRADIYSFVSEKLGKGDDAQVKDLAVEQIKNLLKSDDSVSQQIGYHFLIQSKFLSEVKKRDVGKEILEFLRQPGKILNENNRLSLKAVTHVFSELQETPKRDFTYLILDAVRQDKNLPALQVILEIVQEISPKFSDYEKDYKDLLERLKNWPEGETKFFVISKLKELKSKTPNKTEKEFWSEIDKLTAS